MPTPIVVNDDGKERTPTLRKWLTLNKLPNPKRLFTARLIFVSAEYKSVTLLTESFKVSLYQSSPLYPQVMGFIRECMAEEVPVCVQVEDAGKGTWSLHTQEKEIYDWEETEFGFRCKHTGQTRSPVSRSSKGT
jgi:hypothetical protein